MEEELIKETISHITVDIVDSFSFPEDSLFYQIAVEDFISRLARYMPSLKEQLETQKSEWGGGSNQLIVNCIFILAKGTKGFSSKTAERKKQVFQSIALVKHVLGQTKYVVSRPLLENSMQL